MTTIIRRCLNWLCRLTTNTGLDLEKNEKKQKNEKNQKNNTIIEWSQTIPFIPPITQGIVIKVYDGDTITIASRLPYEKSELYRFSVRLNGIDSPEIKGKTEDEKIAAHVSQKALEDLILHKHVILKNTNTEKYGRILADVYCEDIHLNQWLLDKKLAIPYNGKTKHTPDSWIEYQSN